jgi:hypothetical protein
MSKISQRALEQDKNLGNMYGRESGKVWVRKNGVVAPADQAAPRLHLVQMYKQIHANNAPL